MLRRAFLAGPVASLGAQRPSLPQAIADLIETMNAQAAALNSYVAAINVHLDSPYSGDVLDARVVLAWQGIEQCWRRMEPAMSRLRSAMRRWITGR